ncbi:hypothetical protein ACJJTC_012889 [Scirpophaga incertulas]
MMIFSAGLWSRSTVQMVPWIEGAVGWSQGQVEAPGSDIRRSLYYAGLSDDSQFRQAAASDIFSRPTIWANSPRDTGIGAGAFPQRPMDRSVLGTGLPVNYGYIPIGSTEGQLLSGLPVTSDYTELPYPPGQLPPFNEEFERTVGGARRRMRVDPAATHVFPQSPIVVQAVPAQQGNQSQALLPQIKKVRWYLIVVTTNPLSTAVQTPPFYIGMRFPYPTNQYAYQNLAQPPMYIPRAECSVKYISEKQLACLEAVLAPRRGPSTVDTPDLERIIEILKNV